MSLETDHPYRGYVRSHKSLNDGVDRDFIEAGIAASISRSPQTLHLELAGTVVSHETFVSALDEGLPRGGMDGAIL